SSNGEVERGLRRPAVSGCCCVGGGRAGARGRDWELIKTVVEEQESESDDLTAATYLTITVSGNTIKGTTHGGKTFSGTGAKGFGTGAGYLNKGKNIYDVTVSYEVLAGTGVQNILFKDAKGKTVGTWSGTIVPPVPASKGPGKFTR
ncbi:hypothetical protein GOP47_0031222, partial [Adiantum capillus-veneris]